MNVALLIPVLNGGDLWATALSAISAQSLTIGTKLVVDSGSIDGSEEKAKYHGFTVCRILQSDFDHGRTRQWMVDCVDGADVVIFLTQDCVLADPFSLERLLDCFNDPKVGLSYGRQVPRDHANPLEAHARFYNYRPKSLIKTYESRSSLGFMTVHCSNSFAAYRVSALKEVGGFSTLSGVGEDVIVAGKMLLQGWKLAYVAEAVAHHSHNYSMFSEFRRYFDIGVFHRDARWIIDKFGEPDGHGLRYARSEFMYIVKRRPAYLGKMICSLLAKWLGYKFGLHYKNLPSGWRSRMSMLNSSKKKVTRQ